MLVDLSRNDLQRVCRAGTVTLKPPTSLIASLAPSNQSG